jgi:hypothetical protein
MSASGKLGSKRDLDKFIADFEKDKKKGELPPDIEPKF